MRSALARSALPPGLALAAFGLLFAPWARTGHVTRSGYGLAQAAALAGVAHGTWAHALVTSVFVLPLLAGAACAAAALGLPRVAATVSGLAGAVLLVASAGLLSTSGAQVMPGLWAGAATGCCAVVLSVSCTSRGSPQNARRRAA